MVVGVTLPLPLFPFNFVIQVSMEKPYPYMALILTDSKMSDLEHADEFVLLSKDSLKS